jgi:Tol biopolymer transport system component
VAAPLDLKTLKLTEGAVPIVRPLEGGELAALSRFAISRRGALATLPENIRYDLTRLAWYEPDGTWTQIAEGGVSIDAPRVSPDGRCISVLMGRSGGDVWVFNLERGTRQVLTQGDHHQHPVWTPDGKYLVFTTSHPGAPLRLERCIADGSAPPETLWEPVPGAWLYPTDFAPDGKLLLTLNQQGSDPMDLFVFDPQTREQPRRLMPTRASRYGARLSPDGTMIAYTSMETGEQQVYLQRYPSLDDKIPVSASRGYRPVWTRDGKQLFFRYADRVMVVDLSRGTDGKIGLSPARLVAEHMPDSRYDVDATGSRLLMGRPAGVLGPQTKIEVVTGWNPASP